MSGILDRSRALLVTALEHVVGDEAKSTVKSWRVLRTR